MQLHFRLSRASVAAISPMGENSGSSDQVITAPDTSTCSLLLHSTPADSMGHMGHTTDSPHLPCSVASLTATTSSTNTPTSVSSEQSSFILEPNFGQAALTHLSNTGNNTQQIITTTTGNNYSIVSSSSINSSSNQQLPVQVNQQQQVSSSPPVTSVTPVTYQFSPSSANCSTSGGNNTITGCIPVPQPPPVLPGHHHNISSASSTASSASGFNSISSNYNSNSTSNSSNNHHHHHHHHNNTSNSNNNNNNNNQNSNMHTTADYLAQLLKDQKQVSAFPGVFYQVERLLNEGEYLPFPSFLCQQVTERSTCFSGISQAHTRLSLLHMPTQTVTKCLPSLVPLQYGPVIHIEYPIFHKTIERP